MAQVQDDAGIQGHSNSAALWRNLWGVQEGVREVAVGPAGDDDFDTEDPVRERGFWFSYAHIRAGTVSHEAVGISSNKRAQQAEAQSYYGPASIEAKRRRTDDLTPLLLTTQHIKCSSKKEEKGTMASASKPPRPNVRVHSDTPLQTTALSSSNVSGDREGGKEGYTPSVTNDSEDLPTIAPGPTAQDARQDAEEKEEPRTIQYDTRLVDLQTTPGYTSADQSVDVSRRNGATEMKTSTRSEIAPPELKADYPTSLRLTALNLKMLSEKQEQDVMVAKSEFPRPKSVGGHGDIPFSLAAPTANTSCHVEVTRRGDTPSTSTESEVSPKNVSGFLGSTAHGVESSSQVEEDKEIHTPASSTKSEASLKKGSTPFPSTAQDGKSSLPVEDEKGEAALSVSPGLGMEMEDSQADTPKRASNADNETNATTNAEEERKGERSTLTSSGSEISSSERREYEFYLPVSRDEYLAQRVLTPDEYLREIIELKQKRTPGVPDERLPKIPVPLAAGKTIAGYEQLFIYWISKRHQSLESLYVEPMKERGLRFQFALETAFSMESTVARKPNREAKREDDARSNTVEGSASLEPSRAPFVSPLACLADVSTIGRTSTQNFATRFHKKLSIASTTADAVVGLRSTDFKTVDKSCTTSATDIIPSWATKLVARVQELEAKVEKLELELNSNRAAAGIHGSSSGGQSAQISKTCTGCVKAGELRQPPRVSPAISTQTTDAVEDCGNQGSNSCQHVFNADKKTGEHAKNPGENAASDRQVPATTSKRITRGMAARAQLMEMFTTSSADILRDGMIGLAEAVQSRVVNETCRKQKLTEAYSHLNDRISLNETAINDATAYVKTIKDADKAVAMEHHNQIMELVVSINKEKEKRSAALAAVTVQHWTGRKPDLSLLVNAKPSEDTRRGPTHENLASLLSRVDKAKSILDDQDTELGWHLQAVCAIPPTVRGIPRALRFSALQKMTARVRQQLATKEKLEADFENLLTRFVVRDEQVRRSVAELLDGTRRF
jgi:hypothetical protein